MGRGAAKEGEREGSVLKEAIQFVGMWRGVDCGEGRAVGRKGEGEMGERRTRSARGVCIPVSCSKVCVPHLEGEGSLEDWVAEAIGRLTVRGLANEES